MTTIAAPKHSEGGGHQAQFDEQFGEQDVELGQRLARALPDTTTIAVEPTNAIESAAKAKK